MTSKGNMDVIVNVKLDLLYIVTPSPTPGHDPRATLAQSLRIDLGVST